MVISKVSLRSAISSIHVHRPQVRHWSAGRSFAKGRAPRASLPKTPARTRFAPSPTGYLHLGSLRTALFNYLLAKRTGGQFLLRVEDTDQSRTVPDAEEKLYKDLRWAGLYWDEGPDVGGPLGPYKQSERTELYQRHAQQLVDTGHGYRCFCSSERLNELAKRRQALGLPTDYDRTCAGIAREESDERADKGEKFVVRLKAPNAYPVLDDLVYGRIGSTKAGGFNAGVTSKHGEVTFEDPVLLKSDGRPTYHLANVVDDHFMEITHVVRATEWVSSTPKHLALYEAFGWEPPQFAHVGLLVDAEGSKLSKRNHSVNVGAYRDMGILPSAMLNFVALLGWSHTQKNDFMNLAQLVEQFQMKLTKGNTTVSFEKLWYLQKHHVSTAIEAQTSEFDDMLTRICQHVTDVISGKDLEAILTGPSGSVRDLRNYVNSILNADHKQYSTPEKFVQRSIFFFTRPNGVRTEADFTHEEFHTQPALPDILKAYSSLTVDEWNRDKIGAVMESLVDTKDLKQALNRILRRVLLNSQPGPSMAATMEILGRRETLHRFDLYINDQKK